jgi:hypothetical protein
VPEAVDTECLVAAFLDGSLPKPQWTHHAHLRVGLWHVSRFGAGEAARRLRERIRAYNEAVGTANTDTSGSHETLTVFYVRMIAAFLGAGVAPAGETSAALETRLIEALGDRALPLRHYSRVRLYSLEARRTWVAPDLAPLPE